MISSISLENYKCFENETSLNITPLTIFCGTNSSGKTSIIKSLLTMKQTVEANDSSFALQLSGNLVENGTFRDVVFNNDERKQFTITHSFDIEKDDNKYASSYFRLSRIYHIPEDIMKFRIEVHVEVKKSNATDISRFLNSNAINYYSVKVIPIDNNNCIYENDIICISLKKHIKTPEYYLSWSNVPQLFSTKKKMNNYENYACLCSFNGLSITSIASRKRIVLSVRSVFNNIMEILQIATIQYKSIFFIAPLRQNPERTYLLKHNVKNVGIAGENTPIILAQIKNKKTPNIYPYLEVVSETVKYEDVINYWLNRFGIAAFNLQNKNGSVSLKIGKQNISDVGFGVSQVLPIITQSILMKRGETLLIEQPEIHLHPKMALEMADFLISQAQNKINMIIETHSDHIVNRIIRRVMENQELKSLITIYFVGKDIDNTHYCKKIEIDKYNGTEELEDFFTQYASEIEKINEVGLDNMLGEKR